MAANQPTRPKKIRRLGRAEWCNWLIDKAACANFVVKIDVEAGLDPDRFKKELDLAAGRHPILKARVKAGLWWAHFVDPGTPSDIPVKVVAEAVDWRTVVESEMETRFDIRREQPIRVTLLKFDPGHTTLLATFFHAHTDAKSVSLFLLEVLGCYGGAQPGPARQMLPPMEAGFPPRRRGFLRPFFMLRYVGFLLRLAVRFGLPKRLPSTRPKKWFRRQCRITNIMLDTGQSQQLLSQCRAHDTTVQGALMAALLAAQRDLLGDKIGKTQVLASIVNARNYLETPRSDHDIGYHAVFAHTFHLKQEEADFWTNARLCRERIFEQVDRRDLFHMWDMMLPPMVTGPTRLGAKMLMLATGASAQASNITNIGNLGNGHLAGGLKVTSLEFTVCPSAFMPYACTANAVAGRIFVDLIYHQDGLGSEADELLLNKVRDRLLLAAAQPVQSSSLRSQRTCLPLPTSLQELLQPLPQR